MNNLDPGLLTLPAGSEGIFLQDGELHRLLTNQLDTLYHSWGYTPVHTPLVDYADSYAQSVGLTVPSHTYRLVDREGNILSLRSDITVFLMKQINTLLRDVTLPLRLCYSDSILRYQDSIDIGKNEFFQTGAELLGLEGRDGDLEILVLLVEALDAAHAPIPVIHLGSRELFNILFANLDHQTRQALRTSLGMRQWANLLELSDPIPLEPKKATELFSIICSPEDFEQTIQSLNLNLPSEARTALAELSDRGQTLARLFPNLDIRLDLSELGSQDYHSGLVFSAYIDGVDSAVASGGRYDQLLTRMGLNVQAIGFSIMLSKLTAKLQRPEHLETALPAPPGKNFEQRYDQAKKLRASGKKVHL